MQDMIPLTIGSQQPHRHWGHKPTATTLTLQVDSVLQLAAISFKACSVACLDCSKLQSVRLEAVWWQRSSLCSRL